MFNNFVIFFLIALPKHVPGILSTSIILFSYLYMLLHDNIKIESLLGKEQRLYNVP